MVSFSLSRALALCAVLTSFQTRLVTAYPEDAVTQPGVDTSAIVATQEETSFGPAPEQIQEFVSLFVKRLEATTVPNPLEARAKTTSAKKKKKKTTTPVKKKKKTTAKKLAVKTTVKRTTTKSTTKSTTLSTRRTTSTTTSTVTVTRSSSSSISLTSLRPSASQTASSTLVATSGSVQTSLVTSGKPASQPFATSTGSVTSGISLINTASTTLPSTSIKAARSTMNVPDLFVAMASASPPSQVTQRSDHPVPRLNIATQNSKLSTNKFYANFFLGSQNQPTFTHPYSVVWSKGSGAAGSWGMSISHIERSQLAYPAGTSDPVQYFINPAGIQSLILSATEVNNSQTTLSSDTLTAFSANINLLNPASGTAPVITFPLVQGSGFVTAVYNNAAPLIQSSVSVLKLTYAGLLSGTKIHKYTAGLGDQTTWLIYIRPDDATYGGNKFTLTNGYNINAPANFTGSIQIAKIPTSNSAAQDLYDASAGVWPTTAVIAGSASGTTGTYTFSWTKAGATQRPLLMFALPHHIQTLQGANITSITLQTTTKGLATAVVGDSWTLSEDLPTDIGLAPWTISNGPSPNVNAAAKKLINDAATSELAQDMAAQSDLNSMYYSGKALAKFASICFATNDMAGNKTLAYTGLQKLQAAFATFVNNKQIYPLVYESAWGGVVSSGTYQTGQDGLDFGNTYYNDHQFHYAYFVFAAAVIGYLDPTWLTDGNKAWVNMLVRDYANPSTNDPYFPFMRSFDWYHGHSWAKGLYESADGKDQESSSEDSMAAYALKMWGRISSDTSLEGRGTLMMAVQARATQNYYLYTSDNTVQPPRFIGNKAAGILFENKIDHVTYFGSNTEYIQGIHMIPLMPFSPYTRTPTFVQQEWDTYFSNGRVDSVAGGWRGILYANYALINPAGAWGFFSNASFDTSLLDGGASLTWYRAFSAALGGASA